MGLAAKKTCNKPCCPDFQIAGSRFCAKHGEQAKQREYDTKREDQVWMMYQTPHWKHFRAWFLKLNPFCMRVVDGEQCHNVADTVHHLQSPRQRPDLFTDADNVAAVCRTHHHHGEGAQPGEEYVKADTKLSLEERMQ